MPNLTGNTALDVAIGLAFVYLLFSVLCSAVQEAIAGVLDLRAATLEDGLRSLLDDEGSAPEPTGSPRAKPPASGGAPTGTPVHVSAGAPQPNPGSAAAPPYVPHLSDQLLGHGLIRTQYRPSGVLWRRTRRGPSYLSPQMFALALLDLVAPATPGQNTQPDLHASIQANAIPRGTKHALLALAQGAVNDRDKFRANVERWFDGSMDRVSGWYKRKSQIIICVLAALVTIGLNVNTIAIADRLVNDDAVRAAVVTQATTTSAKTGDSLDAVAKDVTGVQQLGLPFGWSQKAGDPEKVDRKHLLRTVGGWLLTFLALSLGAPFWFDALGRIAGLRNSGAKPDPATT